MSMISNDWLDSIEDEFKKPYYKELYTFVREEYSKTVIYPPSDEIFNAFHFTPLSKVKVLLLGQDPYHGENQQRQQIKTLARVWRKGALVSSWWDCKLVRMLWRNV